MSYWQKLSHIQSYLESLFPECSVHIEPEFERSKFRFPSTFRFRVDDPDGRVKHLLGVSEEFLSDFTADQIEKKLETWNVKRVMGEAGRRRVRVTKSGLTVAMRE